MPQKPKQFDIEWIARQVNAGSAGRPIGELQGRRSERLNLSRVPDLFDGRTIKADGRYAFHVGGLAELQFNIGFEDVSGEVRFRHGVAFSLQPTYSQPDIRVLVPRIRKFNEFMRTYPDEFGDMLMWHHQGYEQSEDYAPAPIPERLVRPHVFIMLGLLQPASDVDIEWILDDFDRLVPLYEFVESSEKFPRLARGRIGFSWTPGNTARAPHTTFSRQKLTVDARLQHNVLQNSLFGYLEGKHGKANVSGEQDCGNGTLVDVAVRRGKGFLYYEIKVGLSARSCIRQAVGQLMEYSYWPGAQEARKLIVVGEPPLDADGKTYLRAIRKRFGLPLYYQCIDPSTGQPSE